MTLARAAGGGGNLPPRGPGGRPSASGDFPGGGGSGGGRPPGGGSGGPSDWNRKRITQNYQDHHIIPQQLKDHPLLKAAGFNIHSSAN